MNIHIVLNIFKQQKYLVDIFMRVKLHLKKPINIQPIYWLKLCILGQIRNQRVKKKKQQKQTVLKNLYNFFEGREKTLKAFESYFQNNLRVQAF